MHIRHRHLRCRIVRLRRWRIVGYRHPANAASAATQSVARWHLAGHADTFQLLGLITETGRFHFLREDDAQFFGQISMNGDQVVGSYTAALLIGFEFEDGSNGGTGTIQLDIEERETLEGSFDFTSAAGNQVSGTVSLVYQPLYERDSSLATIAGTYTDSFAPGSDALSIDAAGVLFAQAANTDCVVNGTVRVVNAEYNAYTVTASFSGCTGVDAPLNGIPFSGILTLDNAEQPEAIVGGLTATSGSDYLALVIIYERT